MGDMHPASIFFLIFGAVLALYGAYLLKSGNKELMPLSTTHSIHGPQDVRRVGKIVMVIGISIGMIALVLLVFVR